ncbi:MAG: phosphoribosyltransferase domain-containing protein, partial [Deltaproteobacteria bacterium]|nr:phosphoribosyltransferase domain-containing protein [Deltaproteobacteria bacterium]
MSSNLLEVTLPTGVIRLSVRFSDYPIDELLGFASRYNALRGFLFVSKVLGKHYPVAPRLMTRTYRDLAHKINSVSSIQGPVVFLALAETAIGLGKGIFYEYLNYNPHVLALFIHTTRYSLYGTVAFKIIEPHCHAPEHLVYEPESPLGQEIFANAKTLILIDDEISTGNTLLNLVKAYASKFQKLTQVIVVTLTDLMDMENSLRFLNTCPVDVKRVSLMG